MLLASVARMVESSNNEAIDGWRSRMLRPTCIAKDNNFCKEIIFEMKRISTLEKFEIL